MNEAERVELLSEALRTVAKGAIRCAPCGVRGVVSDAAARYERRHAKSSVLLASIPVCRECLLREAKLGIDSSEPVAQPWYVSVARKALAEVTPTEEEADSGFMFDWPGGK